MSDERMQSLLDTWYRDREVPRPKVQTGVAKLMADVPRTRQQGRSWPLPVFHRKARTPVATDTTEYQPSPIPASNGHASTIIGRTQTVFSPVKAIAAGALVFAIGGVLLIAQPFDQQGGVPGAEQGADPVEPVVVTGTESCGARSSGETTVAPNGAESHRDLVGPCTNIMSDPRVSGTYVNTFNSQCYSPSSVYPSEDCVFWGTHVLEGEDGGWDCTFSGTEDPSGENWGIVHAICPGTGGNEGMTYVYQHAFGGAEDIGNGTSYHGIIYDGPPPGEPWPLPVE